VRDPMIDNVISQVKARIPEVQILLMLKQRNRPLALTGADRGRLEDAGASEILIEAMANPASIGPEVTPEAVATAIRQNAGATRERYAACQAQANRQYPTDRARRAQTLADCIQGK
jgi:hypothetical protein